MVTLTINRKPQGIFSKSPATPLQNKTDTAYKMKAGDQIPQLNDKQKPADKTLDWPPESPDNQYHLFK